MLKTHFQSHMRPSTFVGVGFADKVELSDNVSIPVTNILPIDKFYSQKHNLRNGCVDTSPLVLGNPQAASHVSFSDAEKSLPADLSTEDIHGMVVSKHCQSLAEINALRTLRPDLEQFKSLESEEKLNSPEPSQPVAS